MGPGQLIEQARRQLAEATGLPAEGVTGLRREDDGWVVDVEALEVERVPATMDVLGSYEVTLSDDGELLGFKRRRRYHRAAVEDDDG